MWPEDELYEQWKHAGADERPAIKGKLAGYVRKHLQKAILAKYGIWDEDVIQNAAIAVIEHIEEFEGRDGAVFSTWSHQIALHKAVDEIDRRTRERERLVSMNALLENGEAGWDPPDPLCLNPAARIDYERNLGRLTQAQRQVWDLDQEGHTEKEISERLGITVSAVDSRLRRARKELQKK